MVKVKEYFAKMKDSELLDLYNKAVKQRTELVFMAKLDRETFIRLSYIITNPQRKAKSHV